MNVHHLPNEILLEIYPRLPLKSLIAVQGVCKKWRHLVPLSDILPIRRDLLNLFLHIISSPIFLQSRSWNLLSNLRPFDRQGYLDTLLEEHSYLPEEFCIWILEWPARAVIGGSWPGLPCTDPGLLEGDDVAGLQGSNCLGHMPPQVSIVYRCYIPAGHETRVWDMLPALLVWTSRFSYIWLALDERESMCGKVYELCRNRHCIVGEDVSYEHGVSYSGWIEWQRQRWQRIEEAAEDPQNENWRVVFPYRSSHKFNKPGMSWTRRNELWSVIE
jgi:hypothetical protein